MRDYLRLISRYQGVELSQGVELRKDIEAGQGFMIWVSQTFPYMTSYLCAFYDVLARSRATNLSRTRPQLHELVESLDDRLVIHAPFRGLPSTPGVKLLPLKN